MEAFKYHVYVCDQKKPEGAPCCSARGSAKVIDRLREEIAAKGFMNDVQITTCGSIGLCERGPNMVVYPDGIWYSGVTPEDVAEIVSEHFQNGRVVKRLVNTDVVALRTEIDSNRSKMMAALKAQDEAGVIPDEFLQAIQGFRPSRIIMTAIELDIFSHLKDGASAKELAGKLDLDARATEILLNALTALTLLEKNKDIYKNGGIPSRYLAQGARDDSRMSMMHTVHLWDRWSTLTECVRAGKSVSYKEPEKRSDDYTEAFIAAMHKNASFRANLVARVLDLTKTKKMLDVGGGSGAYSIAFARANKDLRSDVFDLSTVVPLTKKYIAQSGIGDRVATRIGDMLKDDFGSGYDLVLFSAICHMFSPDGNIHIFKKSFKALNPGGQIVMQDYVMGRDKTSPLGGALFAVNMLVGTMGGSTYSEDEYREWLETVGFTDIKKIALPGPTALMVGKKP